MASWTIPAFGRVVTLVLVAWATLSCARPAMQSATTFGPPLRLLKGTQYPVVLRPDGAGEFTIGNAQDSFPGVPAAFSGETAAVGIVAGTANRVTLVAKAVGSARIFARGPGGKDDSLDVHVVDSATAANEMALEICPTNDEALIRSDMPLSGMISAEHGMHDCQRLIKDKAYVSLVGIFAHDNLLLDDRGAFSSGRLAAVIVNFADGKTAQTYDTLGIKAGTNCLLLHAKSATVWEAAVVHRPATGGAHYARCPDAMTWADTGTNAKFLEVVARGGYDPQNTDTAPPAARWDTDAGRTINTIGVKCGKSTWCDILPKQVTPSAPLKNAHGRDLLKGYYDEQFLADTTASAPTTVFGTIRPGADNIGGQKHDNPATSYAIADIVIEETKPPASFDYRRYYKGFVDSSATQFPPVDTASIRVRPVASMNPRHMFAARFGRQVLEDSVVYRRHAHAHGPTSPPPARTARWRWNVKDESTWTFCSPDGCCESVGKLQEN